MAKLVGVPCAIATRLILEGHPALTKPGILAPYTKEICDPIRLELEKEGSLWRSDTCKALCVDTRCLEKENA